MKESELAVFENYLTDSLDDLLQKLCGLGMPFLGKYKSGWSCRLEMHVPSTGCEFTVRSEFDYGTPLEAVRQCAERAITILKTQRT